MYFTLFFFSFLLFLFPVTRISRDQTPAPPSSLFAPHAATRTTSASRVTTLAPRPAAARLPHCCPQPSAPRAAALGSPLPATPPLALCTPRRRTDLRSIPARSSARPRWDELVRENFGGRVNPDLRYIRWFRRFGSAASAHSSVRFGGPTSSTALPARRCRRRRCPHRAPTARGRSRPRRART